MDAMSDEFIGQGFRAIFQKWLLGGRFWALLCAGNEMFEFNYNLRAFLANA